MTENTGRNQGAIVLRDPAGLADGPRTVIVTGLGRSGTSMVARILHDLGLSMGDRIHDVVYEDAEFQSALMLNDRERLDTLVAARNASGRSWGFKLPNMHGRIGIQDLRCFHNPHLVIIYRDIVAVAVRSTLSDLQDNRTALLSALNAQTTLFHFASNSGLPVLLLSYEKFLLAPVQMTRHLAAFCGLGLTEAQAAAIPDMVSPNDPAYDRVAQRTFEGFLEGIAGERVYGWCRGIGMFGPVTIDIFADGRLHDSVVADIYRHDLQQAGIGNGNHGFESWIGGLDGAESIIWAARIKGTTYVVPGSGSSFGQS